MAIIADPTGAVFSVWEPKSHIGTGVRSQPGSLCWADLSTPNPAAGARFYADLFGYEMVGGVDGYLHIRNAGESIGGVATAAQRDPHAPPHWLISIQVDHCAASTAKAKELGANIYMAPMDMANVGVMSVLADPQGAAFALFQPARS